MTQYAEGDALSGTPPFQRVGPMASVYWQDGHAVVYPNTLRVDTHGQLQTVIFWQADLSVDEIVSITFVNANGDFTPPQKLTHRLWMCKDLCLHDGDYKYDITVKHNGVDQAPIDPYVHNEDGGG